jgi:hypothetical protein
MLKSIKYQVIHFTIADYNLQFLCFPFENSHSY